jgi:hypothetical protein
LTILLSNDGVLPLAPALRRVAVAGPGAGDERLPQGDYQYPAHLEGISLQAHDPSGDGILGDGEVLVPHAGGAYAPGPHYTPHVTPRAGQRAGDEVVQLYVQDQVASTARPDRMLVGFARVTLEPGQSRTVVFTVHPSRLAFYDPRMRFVTEPGAFWFGAGASSDDIRTSQIIDLTGDIAEYLQREIVATRLAVE